ncbi:MAG TPA: hypothetical protein EYP14_03015 [Planctomycetaceae bacterium]|nr:hypothetical protein [Planctomycetaceae bacterium]
MANTLAVCVLALVSGAVGDPAQEKALLAPMAADEVRDRVMSWVAESGVTDRKVLESVGALWAWNGEAPEAIELLERAVRSFALCDSAIDRIVQQCGFAEPVPVAPDAGALDEPGRDEFVVANVRLYLARFLTQAALYDEATEQFEKIPLETVIDPATLLFYRAVCEHQLLKKSEALDTLDQLLNHTVSVPDRYASVARLMRYDLVEFRQKSLDEIARKMHDVKRRLSLARAGSRVQKIEQEIVEALDELIKEIQEQADSASSSSGLAGGHSNQSSGPAQDSVIKGAPAPGRVDEKDIGHKSGWGALPPKKETKAKNLINRNFPAHYRQAIDQYFKKLANRRAPSRDSSR